MFLASNNPNTTIMDETVCRRYLVHRIIQLQTFLFFIKLHIFRHLKLDSKFCMRFTIRFS